MFYWIFIVTITATMSVFCMEEKQQLSEKQIVLYKTYDQRYRKNILGVLKQLSTHDKHTRNYDFKKEDQMIPLHNIVFDDSMITHLENYYSLCSEECKQQYQNICFDAFKISLDAQDLPKKMDSYYYKLSPLFWRLQLLLFAKNQELKACDAFFSSLRQELPRMSTFYPVAGYFACLCFFWSYWLIGNPFPEQHIPLMLSSCLPLFSILIAALSQEEVACSCGAIFTLITYLLSLHEDASNFLYYAVLMAPLLHAGWAIKRKKDALWHNRSLQTWKIWKKISQELSSKIAKTYKIS